MKNPVKEWMKSKFYVVILCVFVLIILSFFIFNMINYNSVLKSSYDDFPAISGFDLLGAVTYYEDIGYECQIENKKYIVQTICLHQENASFPVYIVSNRNNEVLSIDIRFTQPLDQENLLIVGNHFYELGKLILDPTDEPDYRNWIDFVFSQNEKQTFYIAGTCYEFTSTSDGISLHIGSLRKF